MGQVRLIGVIVAIDKDFVVPINYAAANLDDGEVVSNCHVKSEQVPSPYMNGDSTYTSFFSFLQFSSLTCVSLYPRSRNVWTDERMWPS